MTAVSWEVKKETNRLLIKFMLEYEKTYNLNIILIDVQNNREIIYEARRITGNCVGIRPTV